MMFRNISTYFLYFLFLFAFGKAVFAESLESIEMENKSLQIEIDSIKAKIVNLENNPSDDPECENISSELKIAKSESEEADSVYTTGSETIKSLSKQISSLEDKERELDTKIKKHKTAQVTTGVLGGVFGLAAGGIGLWSHLEKNKIEKGEYTDPKCVSNIFDESRSGIISKLESELRNKSYNPTSINQNDFPNTLDMLADAGADCLSCCPGKSDECEKSSNSIKDELEKKLAEFRKNNPKTETSDDKWKDKCISIMNYADNLKAVYDNIDRNTAFDYKDKSKCYDYAENNYGEIAIKKTDAKYKAEKNKYSNEWLISECRKEFCSENSFNNSYPSICISECQKVNFSAYIPDDVLCKDVISKHGYKISNLNEVCSFINNMNATSNEKDRCFKYIIQSDHISISIDNISGFMWADKLTNCLNMCECNYPVYPVLQNISDAQNVCKKQCEDNIKMPVREDRKTEPKALDGKDNLQPVVEDISNQEVKSKPNTQSAVEDKPVKTEQTQASQTPVSLPTSLNVTKLYCENIDNKDIQSICKINPYVFESSFKATVSQIFNSRKDGFQRDEGMCTSFKEKLNYIKNNRCSCYLGFKTAGSSAIHFDCITNKYDKTFSSKWDKYPTIMKLEKSNITEGECIDLYKKSSGSFLKTDWCN